jgi:hypothetical protein
MAEREEIYKYQIANMYNKEKYYNPHDVIGVKGLTNAQVRLLDQKKV